MRSTKITILLAVWTLACSAVWSQIEPMSNDSCGSAKILSVGINPSAPLGLSGHVYTNAGATPSASPGSACDSTVNGDVWFSYLPSASGLISISTCTPGGFSSGSLADTVLTVFLLIPLFPNCDTSLASVSCNDNACGGRSSVSFNAGANTTYYIRIAGAGGSTGTFYVVVIPPPGDECLIPIPLAYGSNGPYSILNASTGAPTPGSPCAGPGYRDMWFSITATTCGPLTVDTCGTFDTMAQAFTACGGAQLACNDDGGSGCSPGSRITFTATASATHRIRVSSVSPTPSLLESFTVTVTPGISMTHAWSSPAGPGSIMAALSGPQNGTYFLAATGVAGNYPYGWLFGLDIPYAELATELAAGFPFMGPLGSCGDFTLGPFQGLPSGFTIYSIAFGLLPGASVPAAHSPAISYAVP